MQVLAGLHLIAIKDAPKSCPEPTLASLACLANTFRYFLAHIAGVEVSTRLGNCCCYVWHTIRAHVHATLDVIRSGAALVSGHTCLVDRGLWMNMHNFGISCSAAGCSGVMLSTM